MIERSIIMQAHEVRAVLDGRKAQMRHVVKPQPESSAYDGAINWYSRGRSIAGARPDALVAFAPCPFGQPGDRLLVCSPIPSSPNDDYCAGSDGHIYSRTRYAGFGRKELTDWYPLIGHRDKRKGYVRVSLCHENTKVTRSIHSLICEAFYGKSPFDGAQVRHLDGDPQNNLPDNLAWGTQAENWSDRRQQGKGVEGEKHPQSKLSDEERSHVRWAVKNGLCSARQAARVLGLAQASVCQIMNACELQPTIVEIPDYRVPRILLEVTDVRVERLQAINEMDARAEGAAYHEGLGVGHSGWRHDFGPVYADPRNSFAGLWERLNAARDHGWDANPWVWVVSFKRVDSRVPT